MLMFGHSTVGHIPTETASSSARTAAQDQNFHSTETRILSDGPLCYFRSDSLISLSATPISLLRRFASSRYLSSNFTRADEPNDVWKRNLLEIRVSEHLSALTLYGFTLRVSDLYPVAFIQCAEWPNHALQRTRLRVMPRASGLRLSALRARVTPRRRVAELGVVRRFLASRGIER